MAALELLIQVRRKRTWQDAQHQYMDIAQQAGERTAQYVAAVTEVTTAIAHTRPHLTFRRAAAAVVAGSAVVQDRAGRNQVHRCRIHLLKFSHLHQSERPLRLEQRYNLNFVMLSYVMLGMTVKE